MKIPAAVACLGLLALPLRADHGPGTSGGGMGVQSGETLRAGRWALELRSDETVFKSLSDDQIRAKAASAGDIDLLDRSLLHTLSLAYGLSDAFQLSLSTGYYQASGGATASYDADTGSLTRVSNRPSGLTDLWIQGKWAFYKGPSGRFAAFAGLKAPTGRKEVRDEAGEPVDFASTPGSGATDFQAGLGYSTFLTAAWTLDASLGRTLRGSYRGYRLGDRTDAGLALAYRWTARTGTFLELNYREIGAVSRDGLVDDNSGGRALFLSPGLRVLMGPALTVAVQVPLVQHPRGAQIETRFKAVAALAWTF